MTDDFQNLQDRVTQLEFKLNEIVYPDRYQFPRTVRFSGKMIGFFNKPPISQPSAIPTANTVGGTYNQTDVQSISNAINALITAIKNLGLTL